MNISIDEDFNVNTVKRYMSIKQHISDNDIFKVQGTSKDFFQNMIAEDCCTPGLLLGYVQSGKTNGELMTMAYALDSGFRKFIFLTSSDIGIYNQTVKRLKETRFSAKIITKEELKIGNLNISDELDSSNAIIIVCPKYSSWLEKLNEIMDSDNYNEKWIIYDDEADYASMDTNKRKNNEDRSTINKYIFEFLNEFNCEAYIQVTATPQALLLQCLDDTFRPKYIGVLEPGTGYVGGDILFLAKDSRQKFLRIYEEEEVNMCHLEDGTSIIPESLKQAICSFIIATTVKYLMNKDGSDSYVCMIHNSYKKEDHQDIYFNIQLFILAIGKFLRDSHKISKSPEFEEMFKKFKTAYDDLSNTVNNIPDMSKIIETLKKLFHSNSVYIINSDTEDDLKLDSVYNIIIGGNKLSRGITIENLITVYYGRNPNIANSDTMNQHARMYGYREKDLDVIRIFTTKNIVKRFQAIAFQDKVIREFIKYDLTYKKIIPIYLCGKRGLKATRSNVIPQNLCIYKSGMEIFPHKPKYLKKEVECNTKKLDGLLKKYVGYKKDPAKKVNIDFLLNILNYVDSNYYKNEHWDDNMVKNILNNMKNMKDRYNNEAYIVVRKDRNLGKTFTRDIEGQLGSVLAGNEKESLSNHKFPTLFMYRVKGEKKKGWDDYPFWVPVFVFPNDKNYLFITNLY